ncbi:MAG: homoaconitase [Phycisphaerae bacterium]|nr:homoaconitase [Phycisphaerae bacterium]
MGQTLIEKIVNRYTVGLDTGQLAHAGDYVSIKPLHVMTHDNTGAVIPKFETIGAERIRDPRQPVFCLDHDIQNHSASNLAKYAKIQKFAESHGVDFHPAGSGIGHQIMIEQGYVRPGALVVASDSHSNLYGGAAALGTPVVRTDAAAIWASGQTWWQVPPVVQVELQGLLQPGVAGKDLIIALCGAFNNDEVLNCAVEFTGDGIAGLSMDQRLTIANMTTEWGALAGVFPFDEVLRDYLHGRADLFAERGDRHPQYTREQVDQWYAERLKPDPDAYYAKELAIDLSQVVPHVAGPNEVKTITPLTRIQAKRVKVDKAYLLSCVNARLDDIAAAAEVLKGKKVASHVKLYLSAASAEVESNARRLGYWEQLIAAGAIALPSGCGPCIGLGEGTLESGEVGISATNRNFKGRMGARDSQVYLAGPAVVAASAVAGYICSPTEYPDTQLVTHYKENPPPVQAAGMTEIIEGFPHQVTGRLLWLPKDNLNTDGIYGKDYTYRDDLSPEEMGKVAMLNYDPEFQSKAAEGDIIVGGRNFGSGSSREQAATALAFRGIRMVIAASFSQTYKRNAFNNGFIVIECPELVDELAVALKSRAGAGELTIPTSDQAQIDFAGSAIEYGGKSYVFQALGRVPQELIVAGGVENLVRQR